MVAFVLFGYLSAIKLAFTLGIDITGEDRHFYEGKLITARYYFNYELPKTQSRHETLVHPDTLTLDLQNQHLS